MIVPESDLRYALGLENPTDMDKGRLLMARQIADSIVAAHIGYDPQQRVAVEYYPKYATTPSATQGGGSTGTWDTNGIRAIFRPDESGLAELQLARLPVRSITSIFEDTDGRFGQQAGAFGPETLIQPGQDYWIEWSQDGYGESGLLHRVGRWLPEPGSIKITYRAGFSRTELDGQATAPSVSDDGEITTAGVNAYSIKHAANLIALKAFKTFKVQGFQRVAGFVAGVITSEKLGDYSYQIGSGGGAGSGGAGLTSMQVDIPPESAMALQPYVNYGIMLGGG